MLRGEDVHVLRGEDVHVLRGCSCVERMFMC